MVSQGVKARNLAGGHVTLGPASPPDRHPVTTRDDALPASETEARWSTLRAILARAVRRQCPAWLANDAEDTAQVAVAKLMASDQYDRAFEVGERLRARVILEYLSRAGVPRTAVASGPDRAATVTARIAATQRRLLSSSLTEIERRALTDHLALLELERGESEDGQVPPLDAETASFATVETVQATLEADEAMVWFSIAPWTDLYDDFGGAA